jgi:CBS domain-containing protein
MIDPRIRGRIATAGGAGPWVAAPCHAPAVDVVDFLRRYPPFSELTARRLAKLARAVEIAYFPEGEVILRKEGPPAEALYVVRKGAVALLDDGEVLDVLTDGEVFGQFSLLAHDAPTLTVRAREDTLCYLISLNHAADLLLSDPGRVFLLGSMRRRLKAAVAHATARAADGREAPVGGLLRRPLVTARPEETVADAAARMAAEHISSLLIAMNGGWGILTDHDLRTKVVAERLSFDAPIRAIASYPARTITSDTTIGDALATMLADSIHHLPVTDGAHVVGVVSDTDLMGIGLHRPFALKRDILRAPTVDALAALGRELPGVALALVEASADAVDIGRSIALVGDAMVLRLVELAAADLGEPPAPFAWLALGSAARHEQSLASDQVHALAFELPEAVKREEVDPWLASLAEFVTAGLERAGARCHGDAMATRSAMRLPLDSWAERLRSWIEEPNPEGSILASIGFDFRRQAGPLDAESTLDSALREARLHPRFVKMLGRVALSRTPPTGFFGDLVVERRGEHAGTLDVKRRGITIVASIARAVGLSAGSSAVSTLDRLAAARDADAIDAATAEDLRDAFAFLWHIRLGHQAAQVGEGKPPDDSVDPRTLGAVERSGLKEAFQVLRRGQRELALRLRLDLR